MIDTEQIKQGTNLIERAGQVTTLRRESRNEYSGPCPKCGGRDRFHVRREWFFCRQCHEKRGDAIEFVSWLHGVPFRRACEMLGGQAATPRTEKRRPSPTPRRRPGPRLRKSALAAMQERLFNDERARPGREYLEGRGLHCLSWLTFGFGYTPDAVGRGPAIAMPWYRAGKLTAIRYRLLHPVGRQKILSEPGSTFAGGLYGGHVLPDFVRLPPEPNQRPAEADRALILIEGELNAASIWQAAGRARVDVLSIGSDTQPIPPGAAALAGRYGLVVAWLDRPELARRVAAALPAAHAVSSPGGRDANDLLQAGLLGGMIARLRVQAAAGDRDRLQALFWDYYDAARDINGVDAGTAAELQALAGQLGRDLDIYEPEPGRWIVRV